MATFSSPGIGSGLDIRSIVSQLVELEKRPLQQVQQRAERAQLRLSTVGEIKSRLAALDDALQTLTRSSTFRERAVTSGNTAISGTALFTATPADYAIQVTQLARGQSTQSAALGATEAVGSGTLTIAMGRWTGGTFTPDTARSPLNITITASDTVADVARKINEASGAVTASLVNDASGSRLVVRSRATGELEGFRVQVTDTDGDVEDGAGLSRLAYDPENIVNPSAAMTLGQAAQDTVVTIDVIAVRSADTTIRDAIAGVTLTVSATTTGPVNVRVTQSTDAARRALQTFVEAYNALEARLSDALRYDPATRTAGPLQGDTAMVTLQSGLRRLLSERGPDGRALSDLGIRLGRDGKLSIDDAKLSAALADPAALESTLAATGGAVQGLARQWREVTRGLLDENGRLDLKKTAIESELERLKRQAEKITEKVERTEQRLLAQYGRLDTTISRMNALNAYVSQQITQWNRKTE